MRNALITIAALPTRATDALSWLIARSISLRTARQTDGLGAVLAGPARQAVQAAVGLAHVVAEGVVAALAEAGAAVPVVVLAADHPVGKAQLGLRAALQVLGPVLAHCQRPLDRHVADPPLFSQGLGAFWKVICRSMPGFNDQ